MNYYNEIRKKLINNEIYEKVKDYSKERNRVNTYYEVGRLLNDAGKHYGDGIIKKYSIKLSNDIGRRYDVTSLKRMRKFYCLIQKGAPLAHQLMWSHYIELLPLKEYSKKLSSEVGKKYTPSLLYKIIQFYNIYQKVPTLSGNFTWSHWYEMLSIKDINKIKYYIRICNQNNLSVRELREKIKNKEYERLSEETKDKLISKKNNKYILAYTSDKRILSKEYILI